MSVLLPQVWRFIPPLQASGKIQMAIDTWLLDQHYQGLIPPVLRFYIWSSPTISLGYHQRQWPQAWNDLNWQGQKVELVRRPTGGRAVLHQGDLTYAVVTSGLTGSRIETYRRICEFLIQGWRSLGVDLTYGHAGRGYIHNPDCFSTATGADLVLKDGTKLIGSAQLRRGITVLQHGSMQLDLDPVLLAQVFETELPVPMNPVKLSLAVSVQTVMQALIIAASHCFNVEFVEQPLSASEWQAVRAQSAKSLADVTN